MERELLHGEQFGRTGFNFRRAMFNYCAVIRARLWRTRCPCIARPAIDARLALG